MRVGLRRSRSGLDDAVVVSLVRTDDFNDFGIDVGPEVDLDDIESALRAAGVGTLMQDRAHAWISLDWLAPQCVGTRGSHRPQFEAMVAFARQHGWISDDGKSIRGHLQQHV